MTNRLQAVTSFFNPLIASLKPQSNGPSYSNTVNGTLAVDGWVGCYIWYNEEGTGLGTNFALFDVAL